MTAPNELSISNPSPCSESASHARSISGSASPSPTDATRQNSSPPRRYAAPCDPGDGRELLAEAREERVSGGMAERVVVALEPVEVEEHEEGRRHLSPP